MSIVLLRFLFAIYVSVEHKWRFFCATSCKNEKNVVPLQRKTSKIMSRLSMRCLRLPNAAFFRFSCKHVWIIDLTAGVNTRGVRLLLS